MKRLGRDLFDQGAASAVLFRHRLFPGPAQRTTEEVSMSLEFSCLDGRRFHEGAPAALHRTIEQQLRPLSPVCCGKEEFYEDGVDRPVSSRSPNRRRRR